MWIVFWITVAVAVFFDLFILTKRNKALTLQQSFKIVCFWVVLALAFGGLIYIVFGQEKALEYLTGYIVEYTLSVDNMFVFLMIFSYFSIPKENQPKILLYGILGAIVLRFIFVFTGIQLINSFSWIIYIFGIILIYTAAKMIFSEEKEADLEKNMAYRFVKKLLPLKSDSNTDKFFIEENLKIYATPMFAAVVVVEASDIIFAIDSIPAVLSISRDTFVVYTSNIFAIVGLRALYFLLSELASKFKFLKTGVAVILFFVGIKMLCANFYHISTFFSLGIVVLTLFSSIVLSVLNERTQKNKGV
ncbi:MAG: TerC/Alx family metal homeostasis membrane protein [Elusimicrobiota bacterium]|jgi:tellurite resistance protein TerC|nr:TerC/Alx family metal homeostasis membrane protein [Elusimicrobiota bacterium]